MARNPRSNAKKPLPPHEERQKKVMTISLDDMPVIQALTDTQGRFLDDYTDGVSVAYSLVGSAGSGKSFLALYAALEEALDPVKNQYDKIIIVRNPVEVRSLGALPGTLAEKISAFETPYIDICSKLFPKKDKAYDKLKEQAVIEFIPTTHIRGQTFDNAIVIFDEFQSATWHEISSVATRIGKNSKIIFCGDGKQNDLVKKYDISGFDKFLGVTKRMTSVSTYVFTRDDIVRSGFVRDLLIATEDYEAFVE
jgi:predicted ribonuclease YlaK